MSASKNEQHTAFGATSKCPILKCPCDGRTSRLMCLLYALSCYFWMHSMRVDCSFNYFLPYSFEQTFIEKLCNIINALSSSTPSASSVDCTIGVNACLVWNQQCYPHLEVAQKKLLHVTQQCILCMKILRYSTIVRMMV